MKEIKAVVQPSRLAKIRSALRNIKGFPGMTVSKVEGCGHIWSNDDFDGQYRVLCANAPDRRVGR